MVQHGQHGPLLAGSPVFGRGLGGFRAQGLGWLDYCPVLGGFWGVRAQGLGSPKLGSSLGCFFKV